MYIEKNNEIYQKFERQCSLMSQYLFITKKWCGFKKGASEKCEQINDEKNQQISQGHSFSVLKCM